MGTSERRSAIQRDTNSGRGSREPEDQCMRGPGLLRAPGCVR